MSSPDETIEPVGRLRTLWANPQIRFPVSMIGYLLVGGLIVNAALVFYPHELEWFNRLTAGLVHSLMSLFTEESTQHGSIVTLDGFAVSIIIECVGLLEMLIYSACVLAFPAPIRAKLWGIPLGCLAILGFNLIRISALLVVGRYWHASFDFFHIYFWQATLIAMIVGVLYGWIRLFVQR
jgi:archaeosortase B (VPXXXP-CTERM-specific)